MSRVGRAKKSPEISWGSVTGALRPQRLTPTLARRWRNAGLWTDDGFAAVLARRVREMPEREALTDGETRITYRQLSEGIDRVAANLRALGIGEGDVVAIQMPTKTATIPPARLRLTGSPRRAAPTSDAVMGLTAIEIATRVGVVRSSAKDQR